MTFANNDFVNVELDLYANGKLVQTTNEKKGKEAGIQSKEFKEETLIVGKNFILKAVDEDILKAKEKESRTLELKAEEAYGKRQKELLKTFTKRAFDEQKLRAVPGMTYDFNGMYGTVKSVVGGRVLVDFNNPLAGKDIKVEYSVTKKITDIAEKIKVVFASILRLPETMYEVEAKAKDVTLKIPEQLAMMKDQLTKSLEEFVPGIKDYSLKIENLKKE